MPAGLAVAEVSRHRRAGQRWGRQGSAVHSKVNGCTHVGLPLCTFTANLAPARSGSRGQDGRGRIGGLAKLVDQPRSTTPSVDGRHGAIQRLVHPSSVPGNRLVPYPDPARHSPVTMPAGDANATGIYQAQRPTEGRGRLLTPVGISLAELSGR